MPKNYKKGKQDATYAVEDRDGDIIIASRWSRYFEELLNI